MGCLWCKWTRQPVPREQLPQQSIGFGSKLVKPINLVSSMSGAPARARFLRPNSQENDDSQRHSCARLYGRLIVQLARRLLSAGHTVSGRWWRPRSPSSPTGKDALVPWKPVTAHATSQGKQEAILVPWLAFLPSIPLVHTAFLQINKSLSSFLCGHFFPSLAWLLRLLLGRRCAL